MTGTRLSPTAWNSGASYNTSKINCTSSATIFFEQPAPDVIDQIRKSGTYLSFADTLLLIREKSKNILLGSVCSNEPVTPIRSYSNKMIIRFQSGSAPSTHLNTPFRGFKLNFTSVGKGELFLQLHSLVLPLRLHSLTDSFQGASIVWILPAESLSVPDIPTSLPITISALGRSPFPRAGGSH